MKNGTDLMKLKTLLKDIPNLKWFNDCDIEINGVSSHTDLLHPGFLFLAKRGKKYHGNQFISQAIDKGIVAVITDEIDPHYSDLIQVIHPCVSDIESMIAHRFYGDLYPLFLIGITGTSGKTTTSFLIQHFLGHAQISCGLIGSIEYTLTQGKRDSSLTTPDLCQNLNLLKQMQLKGTQAAILEVTSIGLDQGRVSGIDFPIMVFSNLSQDHLDYHLTMENYAKAKTQAFVHLRKDAWAVLNGDDPISMLMAESTQASILWFGLKSHFDLFASDILFHERSMTFFLNWKREKVLITTHLMGMFNVYNILASSSVALLKGVNLQSIQKSLQTFYSVPGRLERIIHPKGTQIFIDYAHKPGALQNVLETLTSFKSGKILTVFGCGGDRDALKRPQMGKIAEQFSDIVILTNDNPRSEDPKAIIKHILDGMIHPEKVIVNLDRKQAILHSVEIAQPEDIILVAGKGHEKKQIFATYVLNFDDRAVIHETCEIKPVL